MRAGGRAVAWAHHVVRCYLIPSSALNRLELEPKEAVHALERRGGTAAVGVRRPPADRALVFIQSDARCGSSRYVVASPSSGLGLGDRHVGKVREWVWEGGAGFAHWLLP